MPRSPEPISRNDSARILNTFHVQTSNTAAQGKKFQYKYTILVPTHQRGALLRGTLRGLLLQEHDDFQVVVSNNYSLDETLSVLSEFADEPRIKIVHTDRKMSMPVHWEFAMDHAEGEYILFLGDDDGVRPDFLSVMDLILAATEANIVKFKTGLYYHYDWVDDKRNTFEFDDRCTNLYFDVDKRLVIAQFCEFTNYTLFPNLLQTLFSIELFRKAKARCKRVFVGAPDWSCPFVLLAEDSARLAYVDSTLGYGGRSRMSNVAYYADASDEFQNQRITDFINELSAEVRFPYHEPQITTQGNFLPAAFSYAKHYYPAELEGFALDPFELSRVIQADIAEEAVSKRQSFWTPSEVHSFRAFVDRLPPAQRGAIRAMAGYPTFRGRVRLLLKSLKRKVIGSLPHSTQERVAARLNRGALSRYPFSTKLDVGGMGIMNGADLMRNFNHIVKQSDEVSDAKDSAAILDAALSPRGRLRLPIEVQE